MKFDFQKYAGELRGHFKEWSVTRLPDNTVAPQAATLENAENLSPWMHVLNTRKARRGTKQKKETDQLQEDNMFGGETERESVPLKQLLDAPDLSRLVILGDPGMGKSVLLNVFTDEKAAELEKDTVNSASLPMPILYELKHYARRKEAGKSLEEQIADSLKSRNLFNTGAEDSQEAFKALAERHSLILMLDGINEVTGKYQQDAVDDIKALASRLRADSRLILTSRLHEAVREIGSDFEVAELDRLDRDAVEGYIKSLLPPTQAGELISSFDELKLWDMARVPLFLHFITRLKSESGIGAIPPNRGLILEEVIEKGLLAHHVGETGKLAAINNAHNLKLDHSQCGEILSRIACRTVRERLGVDFSTKDVKDELEKLRKTKPEEKCWGEVSEADVEQCLYQYGLIEKYDEGGPYGFWHQQVLEYFAALRLAEEIKETGDRFEPESFLRNLINHTSRDSTVAILVGISVQNLPQQFLDTITELAPYLAAKVYGENKGGLRNTCELNADKVLHSLKQKLSLNLKSCNRRSILALKQFYKEGNIILNELLFDSDENIRFWAIYVLRKSGWTGVEESIVEKLGDSNFYVKMAAYEALGEIGGENSKVALRKKLHDKDSNIRRFAKEALDRIETSASREILTDRLTNLNKLEAEQDTNLFQTPGGTYLARKFRKDLISENKERKIAAISNLGVFGDSSFIEELIPLLHSPDKEIVTSTVIALGDIKDESALGPLIEKLVTADRSLKQRIIISLKMIGGFDAVESIIGMLDDDYSSVRSVARGALGKIKWDSEKKELLGSTFDKLEAIVSCESNNLEYRDAAQEAIFSIEANSGWRLLPRPNEIKPPGSFTSAKNWTKNKLVPEIEKQFTKDLAKKIVKCWWLLVLLIPIFLWLLVRSFL